MYEAVRTGGEPYFPTWYRWGYGWPLGRGYKELTEEEVKLVEQNLQFINKDSKIIQNSSFFQICPDTQTVVFKAQPEIYCFPFAKKTEVFG